MPPGSSSRRVYRRFSPTLVRLQRFKTARLNVSIGNDANFSTVHGDQYNNYTIQQKRVARFIVGTEEEEDEYEQFRQVLRGDVVAFRNVHCGPRRRWQYDGAQNWQLVEYGKQTVVAGQVIIGEATSECLAVSYSGEGAEERWKEDFRQFGGVRTAKNVQLIAINLSSIPMLILTGDLVPIAHLKARVGVMGQTYLEILATQMGCLLDDSLWMDASRGVFCRGPQGPFCALGHYADFEESLPLDAKLLQENILVRYFGSRRSSNLDRHAAHWFSHPQYYDTSPISVGQPIVGSTLTKTIFAVGTGVWKEDKDGCLGEREILSNGVTRFTLKPDQCRLKLEFDWAETRFDWLMQALSIFHAHGISIESDLSVNKLILPRELTATLSDLGARQRRREKCSPIYLFVSTSIFWSRDPNGQTSIPTNLCHFFGLPPTLLPKCYRYSWPTANYKLLRAYQIARGFDPITADFARHNGRPIYEIAGQTLPGHFEEINDPGLESPKGSLHSPAQPAVSTGSAHKQELSLVLHRDPQFEGKSLPLHTSLISLQLLFPSRRDTTAPENTASAVHTSRMDQPLQRGPPSNSSEKESTEPPRKPLGAASLRRTARQTVSSLKPASKPVLPRPTRTSTVPHKPRFSTTMTKPTELSARKPLHLQSTLSTGGNKNRTKETPRSREVIAGGKNTTVDTHPRNSGDSAIATASTRKEMGKVTSIRGARSTHSRDSSVVLPRKLSTPSGTAARTSISPSTSTLTFTTTTAMRRSAPAPSVPEKSVPKRRVESTGAQMRAGAASDITQPHQPNQTVTSASTIPRPEIPKNTNLNAGGTTVSSTQPPSTRLAGTAGSSQANASRPSLVHSPMQECISKRRLAESSSVEERSRTLARTSKEFPNVPPPVATTSSRRTITRPAMRWR